MTRLALLAVVGFSLALSSYAEDLKILKVNKMMPARCYAGSRVDKQALGGFGPCDNMPRRLDGSSSFSPNTVSLVAIPTNSVAVDEYDGFRLLLVNRTKDEVAFNAEDSRLPIFREALDEKGKWNPIEYIPDSFCGNSAHRVFLPADHFWEFLVPRYQGTFKTRMRFVFQKSEDQSLYSDEFEGTINLSQFKRDEGKSAPVKPDPELHSEFE